MILKFRIHFLSSPEVLENIENNLNPLSFWNDSLEVGKLPNLC